MFLVICIWGWVKCVLLIHFRFVLWLLTFDILNPSFPGFSMNWWVSNSNSILFSHISNCKELAVKNSTRSTSVLKVFTFFLVSLVELLQSLEDTLCDEVCSWVTSWSLVILMTSSLPVTSRMNRNFHTETIAFIFISTRDVLCEFYNTRWWNAVFQSLLVFTRKQ